MLALFENIRLFVLRVKNYSMRAKWVFVSPLIIIGDDFDKPEKCSRKSSSKGRLRECAKRDEPNSGDGSGNVSGAGLDLTGSGHSSRRVRGLWLACPIKLDLVRKRPQNTLTSLGLDFWSLELDFLELFIVWLFSFAHQSFLLWSCWLRYLFPRRPRKNGVTWHSGSNFLFISKRTHGGSTSSLRRTVRSVPADSSSSTKKKSEEQQFFMVIQSFMVGF